MESTITPIDFQNSLKKLKIGLDKCTVNTVQHLFDDKDTIEVLTFFCKNVSHENLVTNEELTAFTNLESKGLILEGDELEQAIHEIDEMYPELLELDEEDLSLLQEEFENEKKYLTNLESLIDVETKNNGHLSDSIRLLEEENIRLTASSKVQSENLLTLSTQLNVTQENLKKSIFELTEFYQNSPTSYADHFIQNTKSNIELLQNYLYNMKTGLNHFQSHACHNNTLFANLNALKLSLKESLELNVITACEFRFQKDVYETMRALDPPTLPSSLDYEIFRMQNNVQLLQQDIASMNCSLSASIEEFADNKISEVMVTFAAAKLNRYVKTDEKITNVLNHVQNVRNQCGIFHEFLRFIFDGLVEHQQIILDTIQQLSNDQSNTNKRMAHMNFVIDEYKSIQSQPILHTNKFLQILSKLVRNTDDSIPENLIELSHNCGQLETNFKRKQNNMFKMECQLLTNISSPLKIQIQPLLKFIFSDEHSNRIVADDVQVLKVLHEIEDSLTVETEKLEYLASKLKKTMKQLSSDKWFNYQHFLWVWFLRSPKKVHKVLRELKDEIKKLSQE